MSDEDVIRDLAEQVEKLRLAHHVKEADIVESAGMTRKTLYNFKQGTTGFSLKNFIRLLKALGEANRLRSMFPESESYSPRPESATDLPKRIRDKQKTDRDFRWGDET